MPGIHTAIQTGCLDAYKYTHTYACMQAGTHAGSQACSEITIHNTYIHIHAYIYTSHTYMHKNTHIHTCMQSQLQAGTQGYTHHTNIHTYLKRVAHTTRDGHIHRQANNHTNIRTCIKSYM